jgi:hypothetical protein
LREERRNGRAYELPPITITCAGQCRTASRFLLAGWLDAEGG